MDRHRSMETVTNPHLTHRRETEVRVHGAKPVSAAGRTLAETDVKVHNTFDRPNSVVPRDHTARIVGESIAVSLAPASVTRLSITLQ